MNGRKEKQKKTPESRELQKILLAFYIIYILTEHMDCCFTKYFLLFPLSDQHCIFLYDDWVDRSSLSGPFFIIIINSLMFYTFYSYILNIKQKT